MTTGTALRHILTLTLSLALTLSLTLTPTLTLTPEAGPRYLRPALEPTLIKHGVTAVVAGHVHNYERTAPMRNGTATTKDPVHVTVGNAGDIEGRLPSRRCTPLLVMNAPSALHGRHDPRLEAASPRMVPGPVS